MSDEHRLAWLRHPATKAIRKQLKEQHRLTTEALMNRAKHSSDPMVRETYAQLKVLNETLASLKDTDEE